jgi:hypothetical protein
MVNKITTKVSKKEGKSGQKYILINTFKNIISRPLKATSKNLVNNPKIIMIENNYQTIVLL